MVGRDKWIALQMRYFFYEETLFYIEAQFRIFSILTKKYTNREIAVRTTKLERASASVVMLRAGPVPTSDMLDMTRLSITALDG